MSLLRSLLNSIWNQEQCGKCQSVWDNTPPSSRYLRWPVYAEASRFRENPICRGCFVLREAVKVICPLDKVQGKLNINKEDGLSILVLGTHSFGNAMDGMVRIFMDEANASCPWPTVGIARNVSLDALSNGCIQLAVAWLNKCLESHPECRQQFPDESKLPTRVIDVGNPDREPRLLHSFNSIGAKYVALSYCWGGHIPLTTTLSTLDQRQKAIPLLTMPRTFQDAVFVTRKLGIRYLWIDSICIIQDSAEDWANEAAHMQDIYERATITIAADAGTNANSGLSSDKRRLVHGDRIHGENVFASKYLGGVQDSPAHGLATHNSILSKRAWILQERIFSRRILHFGEFEMAWECKEVMQCECTVKGQVPDETGAYSSYNIYEYSRYFTKDLQGGDFTTCWVGLVEEYTRRSLTVQSDRLPAIGGLASRAAKAWSATYAVGLWEEYLLPLLHWTSHGSAIRHLQYYCPSWSWASIIGHIKFDIMCKLKERQFYPQWLKQQYSITVKKLECTFKDNNRFGSPLNGYLDVEVLATQAIIGDVKKTHHIDIHGIEPDDAFTSPDINNWEEFMESKGYLFLRTSERFTSDSSDKRNHTFLKPSDKSDFNEFFRLTTVKKIVYGLIVYPSDRAEGVYQRVGLHWYRLSASDDNKSMYQKMFLRLV